MTNFRLSVQHTDSHCLFTLMWDGERQLGAQVPTPSGLMQRYRDWQQAYRRFYQTLPISLEPPEASGGLRGKAIGGGSVIATPDDRRMALVEAELRLLNDFHRWLRLPELHDIRSEIAQASRTAATVNLFLTCSPDIARLPWEVWEIGREFAASGSIRIARTPDTIRAAAAVPRASRRRPRVLAILGDDTGLNFQEDRKAVQSLASRAEVVFVGWQPGVDIEALKRDIVAAIADERGWDILFFAGHSNEKAGLGGELAIAPNTAIAVGEIKRHLQVAQQRGLQFALFNSCSGMDIAATLIDLGLNQVAVMREPVHNRVAQIFLPRFLQSLAAYEDVHTALVAATAFLKSSAGLTYPSADLVPSLFRRPNAPLFQLQPYGWKQRLRQVVPRRREAIAVGLLAALSWALPVQGGLLERRVLAQALYRQATGRAEPMARPPVLLVQIDEDSLRAANIPEPNPISREYLASIIEALADDAPAVVGVDYLLDRPHEETAALAQTVQEAIAQGTDFAFASLREQGQWLYALPEIAGGSPPGDMGIRLQHMTPPLPEADDPPPLAYVLAGLSQPQPLPRSVRHPLTAFSFGIGQRWLEPIVDYSIPPSQVYAPISAQALLAGTASLPQPLSQQVVIIAPGGYAEAGIGREKDSFPPTLAMRHWYEQRDRRDRHRKMTGGEVHAYKTHHLLQQRLVVPIPDLWMVLTVALVATAISYGYGRGAPRLSRGTLAAAAAVTGAYALLCLELYLSPAAVLLPIVFPVATAWTYGLLRITSNP